MSNKKRPGPEIFAKLMEIKDKYPELIFDNNGYEYLSPAVKEKHKEQIEEISALLKEQFPDFVRFDNFKPRKNGTFSIRCQSHYSVSFVGVEYLEEAHFQDEPDIPENTDNHE